MRRVFVLFGLLAMIAGCQMRPYNPLLGKWDSASPHEGRLLIFNNDGTFVLETMEGTRKRAEEGKYRRSGSDIELELTPPEGGGQTLRGTLQEENRALSYRDGAREFVFRKR